MKRLIRECLPPAGVTSVELLVSSVFGAMLLTALAYATTTFVVGVTHMEKEAGFTDGHSRVLRRMTREIREAWWAEIVNPERLRLADANNEISEYYRDGNDLRLLRPNGDIGVLLSNVDALAFEGAGISRRREGTPTAWDSAFYARTMPGSTPFALEVPEDGKLALGFQAPVHDDDLPSGGVLGDEAVLSMGLELLTMPIAWVPASTPENLVIKIYESRAPGSARPYGPTIGSVSVPGSALPAAVWNETSERWDMPTSTVALSVTGIAPSLGLGTGYVILLNATGDAQLVTVAQLETPAASRDDVAMSEGSSGFTKLPLAVPFTLSGPYTLSSSQDTEVVATVSIQLTLIGQDAQIRSATLIGQSLSEDPWEGIIPGEIDP
jgi:hypothetical protein